MSTLESGDMIFQLRSGLMQVSAKLWRETRLIIIPTTDGNWRVAVRELILPASSYFRRRIATDVVVVGSDMVSGVGGNPVLLAVAPVTTSATTHTTVYQPPHPAFFDFHIKQLYSFEFRLTNSQGDPIRCIAGSPDFYLSLVFASDI